MTCATLSAMPASGAPGRQPRRRVRHRLRPRRSTSALLAADHRRADRDRRRRDPASPSRPNRPASPCTCATPSPPTARPRWRRRASAAESWDAAPHRGQGGAGVRGDQTDKGEAIDILREQDDASAVVFFGDDVTDEKAFRRMRDGDVGVKVGPGETLARLPGRLARGRRRRAGATCSERPTAHG